MKLRARVLLIITIFVLATGCSKVVVRSDSDPSTDFTKIETLYVQPLETDERGVYKILNNKLNEFGFTSTTGSLMDPAQPVDAIVTYEDRWMWDITMYMLSIDIHFLDPKTDFEFASGSSYRTSLVREPPEVMIDEALRDLLTGKIDLPPKKEVVKEEAEENGL